MYKNSNQDNRPILNPVAYDLNPALVSFKKNFFYFII